MRKKCLKDLFRAASWRTLVLSGLVLLVLAGCEEEVVPSGEKNIIGFKIGEKLGAINQADKTISVVLGADADLTELEPVFYVSPGASVYPGSGEKVDISSPISYTVTAEDGTIQSYTVTVSKLPVEVVLTGLVIKSPPLKTVYGLYESFDPTGLIVVGKYSDGSAKEEDQYELNGVDTTSTTGEPISVEVKIGELGTSFDIWVRPSSLDKIAITKLPDTITYDHGDTFDSTGLEVTAIYTDNTTEVFDDSQVTISGFNGSQDGVQVIKVSLNGKIDTYEVTVLPQPVLKEIAITKLPDKTTYGDTDEFDSTGLIVTGLYSDGTNAVIALDSLEISGFNNLQPGVQSILVSSNGVIGSFDVTVFAPTVLVDIEIPESPPKVLYIPEEKTQYVDGDQLAENLDLLFSDIINGLVVIGNYSDGSSKIEVIEPTNITGLNPDKSGVQTLRVAVGESAATFEVEIVKLEKIEVTSHGKETYLVGEPLDLSGFVVTGTYSSPGYGYTSRDEIITEANISGFDSSTVGAGKEVTVTVGRQKAYFYVDVYEETSLTISLASDFQVEVYGLPEDNLEQIIKLSLGRKNGLSDMVVISTSSEFNSIEWTIDNKSYKTSNIISINARDLTFGSHVIGFTGRIGSSALYSKTLKLSVTH
jgi:hypothetical protein